MVIYVDIDETICFTPESRDYNLAEPDLEKIKVINRLYDEGNKIIYWTARGRLTKIDWYNVTKKQLKSWGAKYHELDVETKPFYDLLICDKTDLGVRVIVNNTFWGLIFHNEIFQNISEGQKTKGYIKAIRKSDKKVVRRKLKK